LINLTSAHPIHKETQTAGRYETLDIQRQYWTDNFNKPRRANIADPSLFAQPPSTLDQSQKVKLSLPILTHISPNQGSLNTGIYQYAYKLSNLNGATTTISPITAPIVIDAVDDTLFPHFNIEGSIGDVSTSKYLEFIIENIDPNFDKIEVFSIYRSGTGVTKAQRFIEDKLGDSLDYRFRHSGSENNIIDVDLATLTVPGTEVIVTCKTLTHKFNRLFYGNLKTRKAILNYDARAFNFDSSKNATVNDSVGNSVSVWDTFNNTILSPPEDHDSINPNPYQFKYQSDGATFGGTGINVSYKIGTYRIPLDIGNKAPTHTPWISPRNVSTGASVYPGQPALFQPMDVAVNNPKTTIRNFKGAYTSHYVIGYQPDEIYRFAVEFTDKEGNAYDAKWIADIRFPCPIDSTEFAPIKTIANDVYGTILYVEFNITIPSTVRDIVQAFRIVRTERTTNDRTVVGDGKILPLTFTATNPSRLRREGGGNYPWGGSYDCPAFLLGSTQYKAGDYLKMIGTFGSSVSNSINNTSGTDPINYTKLNRFNALPSNTITNNYDIIEAAYKFRMNLLLRILAKDGPTVKTGVIPIEFKNEDQNFNDNGGGVTHYFGSDNYDGTAPFGDQIYWYANNFYVYHKRDLIDQYGGNTYAVRTKNNYIPCGPAIQVEDYLDNAPIVVFGGDTYTTMMDYVKFYNDKPVNKPIYAEYYPTVCRVNTELRSGIHFDKNGYTANINTESFNLAAFRHLPDNIKISIPKQLDVKEVTEYDNKIRASQVKINGEFNDSWSMFQVNEEIDVDGVYGPINAMIAFSDTVFFIQDNAFGILDIQPQAIVQDTSGTALTLGTGEVLNSFRYANTSAGTKHQWSVHVTPSSLYFFDIKTKRLYTMTDKGPAPLTDAKGLQSFFSTNLEGFINIEDNPIAGSGITVGHDSRYHEVLLTFRTQLLDISDVLPTTFTIVFNEKVQAFTSFYTCTPGIYISQKQRLLSVLTNSDTLHRHNSGNYNEFYGVKNSSYVKLLVNPHIQHTKVFDNLEIHSEAYNGTGKNLDETFTQLTVENDYQSSATLSLVPNSTIKRRERTWKVDVPRATDQTRIRDKYMIVTLNFNNPNNRKFIVHYLRTLFRLSAR